MTFCAFFIVHCYHFLSNQLKYVNSLIQKVNNFYNLMSLHDNEKKKCSNFFFGSIFC